MKSLVLSAALACGVALSATQAEVIEEFETADWSGIAYADDTSGAFHNCIVFAGYRNGATLMMIRTVENAWSVVVDHDDFKLAPGNSYPLRYKVDRRQAVQTAASALSDTQLSIAGDDRLIDQIRRGSLLTVVYDGTEYAFELSNSGKALKAAQDCVERHRGRVVQRTAAATDDGAPAAPAETPANETAQGAAAAETAAPEVAPAESTDETTNASTLGQRQEFGHWVVTATDDGAGNFVNCTAFGVYGSYDEQLILSYTPQGKWELGLYRADWSLPTDGSYFLWYNIDRSVEEPGVMKRPVEAAEPTRIFFEVSGLETLIERAATGSQLNLQLRGPDMEPQDLSYSLDQAGPALGATKACVAEHLAQAETAAAGEDVVVEPEAGDTVQVDPPAPAEAVEGGQAEQETAAGQSLPVLGEDNIESFAVPGWEAGAYADATGTFTHCEIAAEYQNGTILGFARAADESLVMTLRRQDWSLQPGQASQIKYQVTWETAPNAIGITGGGLERYGEAVAVDASTMAIEIGSDERFMERLRQPERLNIETEGMSLVFNIDDLPPGLEAIDACRSRHLAAAPAQAEAPQPQQQAASEPSLPPIGEEKVETLDVPGWEGGAYADAAGTFTHCGISAEYQNGAVLAFARTADNALLLALARSDWTLEPKAWSPIRYSFGKDFPINNEGEAQAVNATILATNMGRDDLFTDQLKQSPMLTVTTQGRELKFDISDLAPGLEAIDACRQRHLEPAAAPSGKAAAAPAAEETAEEGRRYIADILTRAGYGDHHMLVGDAVPDGFEDYDAVWEIGEIRGTLKVRPQMEGVELQEVREAIVANDRGLCKGEFDSFNLPGGHAFLADIMDLGLLFAVSCKAPDWAYTAAYTVRPRPSGGYYIVTHLGIGDGEAAKAIASEVFEAGP